MATVRWPSVHLPPSPPCPQSHPRILPRPPPAHCVRPRDPTLEDNPSEPYCVQSELEGSCRTRPGVRWGSQLADAIDLCAGQSIQASKWINPRKHSPAEHIARIGFLTFFCCCCFNTWNNTPLFSGQYECTETRIWGQPQISWWGLLRGGTGKAGAKESPGGTPGALISGLYETACQTDGVCSTPPAGYSRMQYMSSCAFPVFNLFFKITKKKKKGFSEWNVKEMK